MCIRDRTQGAPNTTSTTTFTLSDLSSAYATPAVDSATSVIDNDPVVSPTITGTVAGQTTTNEAPVRPFAHVTISDPYALAIDNLKIFYNTAAGTLSPSANGLISLVGTASAITSELRALVFTPTRGAPNTSSTTTFTLSVKSVNPSNPLRGAEDGTTSVIDSDPAVAPTIAGTVLDQGTTSETPVKPFAHVTVGDANAGVPTDTLTITLGGAGGALADGAGFSGLMTSGGGVYTLSGTAAAITDELDALVFTPTAGAPNTSSTTTFTLSDQSGAGGPPAVDSTTSVIDSDPPSPPAVPAITSASYVGSGATGHWSLGDHSEQYHHPRLLGRRDRRGRQYERALGRLL